MNYANKKTIAKFVLVFGALFFVIGFAIRPTIDRTVAFTKDLFAPVHYAQAAQPSEYERRTDGLFKSTSFQASCKAQASAVIALEIAGEKKREAVYYLDEFDRQNGIAMERFEAPNPVVALGKAATSSVAKK